MDILVAHDHRTGMHYAREFGFMNDWVRTWSWKVVTRVEQLLGYSPPTSFIYVNSDNGEPDPDVLEQLLILESMGCEVDWVGIEDPREELIRLRMLQEARRSLTYERYLLAEGDPPLFEDIWKYLN